MTSSDEVLQFVRALCGTLSMIAGFTMAVSCRSTSQRTFDRQRKVVLHIIMHMAIFDMLYGASFLASWVPLSDLDNTQPGVVAVCDLALCGWCVGSMSALYTAALAWFVHRRIANHAPAPSWSAMRVLLVGAYVAGLSWWAVTLLSLIHI